MAIFLSGGGGGGGLYASFIAVVAQEGAYLFISGVEGAGVN